jgi:hypothetical protein
VNVTNMKIFIELLRRADGVVRQSRRGWSDRPGHYCAVAVLGKWLGAPDAIRYSYLADWLGIKHGNFAFGHPPGERSILAIARMNDVDKMGFAEIADVLQTWLPREMAVRAVEREEETYEA